MEQDSALIHLTSHPTPSAKARPTPAWRRMAELIQKQQTQLQQPKAKTASGDCDEYTEAEKFKAFCCPHMYVYVLRRSVVTNSATPWTVAHQDPLSMGFSWQEYWSGVPFPPPGDLPDPGIKHSALKSRAMAGKFFTTSTTWEAHMVDISITKINPYGNIKERYHFSFYSFTHFYTRPPPHFWLRVPRSCFC